MSSGSEDERTRKPPVITLISIAAALITIGTALGSVVRTESIFPLDTMEEVFLNIITPTVIWIFIFWIAFSTVYITCTLHEHIHKIDVGKEEFIAKNYPLTLWVWGFVTIIVVYSYELTQYGSLNAERSNLLLSNIFSVFGPKSGIIIKNIFGYFCLSLGLVFVALGRVSIKGIIPLTQVRQCPIYRA